MWVIKFNKRKRTRQHQDSSQVLHDSLATAMCYNVNQQLSYIPQRVQTCGWVFLTEMSRMKSVTCHMRQSSQQCKDEIPHTPQGQWNSVHTHHRVSLHTNHRVSWTLYTHTTGSVYTQTTGSVELCTHTPLGQLNSIHTHHRVSWTLYTHTTGSVELCTHTPQGQSNSVHTHHRVSRTLYTHTTGSVELCTHTPQGQWNSVHTHHRVSWTLYTHQHIHNNTWAFWCHLEATC